MGSYVTRIDPSTGLQREYYKADNDKLYNDYNAAAAANMNPLARIQRGIGDRIQKIGNEGLIPVPTFNNTGYSGAGYLKSLAGPLGKPFAIQSNPETDQFLQQTIDAATKNGNTITFNQDIADKEAYDKLGSNIGNKAFGRYTGTVDDQGNVTVKDDYDTNRGVRWPYGTEVVIGNINGAQPIRMAGDADITVDSTAVPGPATNYAVQAGDTLSSIAADRGTTVAELIQRNNIANPDLIQIGQMIR